MASHSHFFSAANVLQRGLPLQQDGSLYGSTLNDVQSGWSGPDSRTAPNWQLKDANTKDPKKATWMDPKHTPKAVGEFMTRFGLHAVVKRNENLLTTLKNPEKAVLEINREYYLLASEMASMYNQYFNELILEGVPAGEAQEKADEYVMPLVNSRLQLLALRYPYNFGASAASVNGEMSQIMFQTPMNGNQALSQLEHLNSTLNKAQLKAAKKAKKKAKKAAQGLQAGGSAL